MSAVVKITSFFSSRSKKVLENFFDSLGQSIYKYPCCFLISGIILSLLCGLGFLKVAVLNDTIRLYIPRNSDIYKEFVIYEDYFGTFSSSMTTLLKTHDGSSILTPDTLNEAFDVYKEALAIKINFEGKDYAYADVCLRPNPASDECDSEEKSFFNLFFDLQSIAWKTQNSINTYINHSKYVSYVDTFVGNKIINEAINTLKYVDGSSLILEFQLIGTSNDKQKELVVAFQRAFMDHFEKNGNRKLISVSYQTSESFNEELQRTVNGDLYLFVISFIAILIYLQVTIGKLTCVTARVWLATSSMLILFLSMIMGFGLGILAGAKINAIAFLLPFILMGVGVDDIIIIVDTHARTPLPGNDRANAGKRLGLALRHSGVSVSLTSFCSIIAFTVGSVTDLYAVKYFCLFAVFVFLGEYILQFLIFVPLFVFDQKRVDANRNFCCCCIVHNQSHKQIMADDADLNEEYSDDMQSGAKISDNEKRKKKDEQQLIVMDKEAIVAVRKCSLPYVLDHTIVWLLSVRWRRWLVIFIFACLAGLSIFVTRYIDTETDVLRLVPDDSYLINFVNSYREAYGVSTVDELIIVIRNLDFSDHQQRANVHNLFSIFLITSLNSHPQKVTNVSNWLVSFEEFAMNKSGHKVSELTSASFYAYLRDYSLHDKYSEWGDELIFDDVNNPTKVIATKFYQNVLQPSAMRDSWDSRKSYVNIFYQHLDKNQGFPFILGWMFAYYSTVIEELTVLNMVYSSIAVFAVLCVVLDFRLATFIFLIICWIDVALFGWMYLVDSPLDSTTFIQCVMAVGLTVDYVIHMVHAIAYACPEDRSSYAPRLRMAFLGNGSSVMKGAISTLLGGLSLAFAKSIAFRSFFFMYAGIILIAVFHGMILAPAIMGEFHSIYSGLSEDDGYSQKCESDDEEYAATDDLLLTDDGISSDISANALEKKFTIIPKRKSII